MTTSTVIALGDSRDTTYTVQTISVSTGQCSAEHGSCGKPGVLAVRNTIDQQRPTESSTYRITVCAEHRAGAAHMHARWVASAREMQDPVKNAEFLASAGVTD
ncbi:hypothetical protein [Streptomyces sp. AK02-04a]|uniref:hypothetical protein n=1 Tax=Streptomyces sp. AK02-04a TaxID=3028649 RepID=UPI0029A695AF|nr:hypothetical protein [Streptomyces sp. AK02-04a]MDX3753997.1 hypothetical protein [Streptomyces sp. AK02-04a]